MLRFATLRNEAATDGKLHADQGGSFLDNPYRAFTELSESWQRAFLQAQTNRAINMVWGKDMPPEQWNQPRVIPDDLMQWQPLYQKPIIY